MHDSQVARQVLPIVTQPAEMLLLEGQLSDRVNEAYGLTPDEVALMWQTAPPRMPNVAGTPK